MTAAIDVTLDALSDLHEECALAAERLARDHHDEIESYRQIAGEAVHQAIDQLKTSVESISGGSEFCRSIIDRTAQYLDWLTWTTWDLPQLAVAQRPDPGELRSRLAASSLLYFAGRILDDFLDRHFLYRARRHTLLASLTNERETGPDAEGLTVITALLMCFEGLARMPSAPQASVVISSARSLLVGIMMERSPRSEWTPEFYERLIERKNVDYWRILYAGLDPELRSPLLPFLTRYYALAQKLNDVQDYGRDESQGRPNLLSVMREGSVPALAEAEKDLAKDFSELGAVAAELNEPERTIALTKLGESLEEARRLGLFAAPTTATESAPPRRLDLYWVSRLDEFVDKAGADAIETIPCPICGSTSAAPTFRKQGFEFQRCGACSHIYVSPRLRASVTQQLAEESDEAPDPFLAPQKFMAENLCRYFKSVAPGPRMLDIGYGAGYLMLMARAYGFQVYGIDTSRARDSKLRKVFGKHLEVSHLSQADLPWGSFDLIVMNHVLEHFADPMAFLPRVFEALRPDGILYVAVPDSESIQFRVFGKEWDAVNPVAHYQFFNQTSLTRAFEKTGFDRVERVHPKPLEGFAKQRWMDMFRDLGGNESGEVAMIGRRPGAEG